MYVQSMILPRLDSSKNIDCSTVVVRLRPNFLYRGPSDLAAQDLCDVGHISPEPISHAARDYRGDLRGRAWDGDDH